MTNNSHRLIDTQGVIDYDGPGLYLFIGVDTGGSSVHDAFPVWAPIIVPGTELRGIDLPESADFGQFRQLVQAMRDNPRVLGAVVTSHKLRLYRAISDLVDRADPLVDVTHEINSLDTRNGIAAFARDPQSLDLVLSARSEPPSFGHSMWCIGAGGSAIALMLAVGLDIPASILVGKPIPAQSARGNVHILSRSLESIAEINSVRERAGLLDSHIELIHTPDSSTVERALARAGDGQVVINATGLGKTSEGSPLACAAAFPLGCTAWDFNYRGPLTFLVQAREAGLGVEDGWDYFLAGWAAALAAISGRDLTPELFARLREASSNLH